MREGQGGRVGAAALATWAALNLVPASPAGAQPVDPAGQVPKVVVQASKAVSRWVRAESPHFVVISDAHDEDVALLVENLEKLDHLLRVYLLPRSEPEPPARRLTLYYHGRHADLDRIDAAGPEGALGRFSSCTAGVQGNVVHRERLVNLDDAQLDKAPLNDSLSTAFEAYARQFLYRHTDIRAPAAIIDGLAVYFSSVRFSRHQMVVGRVPKGIGEYLYFLDQGRKFSLSYEDVLLGRHGHARGYGGAAGVRLEYEARSWLLTHYMLSSPQTRRHMSRFLGLTGRGLAAPEAFERSFGIKFAELDVRLWRYRRQGLQALRVDVPTLPAVRVSVRGLAPAADDLVVLDAALKACPDRQAGEALLQSLTVLASREPADDVARLASGRAHVDWGRAENALPLLNSVLEGHAGHVEARLLRGLAQLRLAERNEGERRLALLQHARQDLQALLVPDPPLPEAAYAAFMADLAAADVPAESTLAAVIRAWPAARDVGPLGRAAALAHAHAGRADAALAILDVLALAPLDASLARWAAQWKGRLEEGVSHADILQAMHERPEPELPFKHWTVDKARAMRSVALGQGLESVGTEINVPQAPPRGDR